MAEMTSHGEAWQGDWRARLGVELRRRGDASLEAFARSKGCVTYSDVASALEGPFAPIQMMMAIRKEFEEKADPIGFVADSLYRYLLEYTKALPSQKKLREVHAAEAIGAWGAAIGPSNDDAIIAVWSTLKERILGGWLPTSPEDPLLVQALQEWRWELGSVSTGA